jgi:hypothetical protein
MKTGQKGLSTAIVSKAQFGRGPRCYPSRGTPSRKKSVSDIFRYGFRYIRFNLGFKKYDKKIRCIQGQRFEQNKIHFLNS